MFGSLFSGLGSGIISGLFANKQQKRGFNQSRELQRIANKFSAEQADIARDFSAQQVAKQMDFQERMSSTQNQRAADDLEKAGLNRILALGRPAVAPPGSAASSPSPSGTGGSPGPGAGGAAAQGMQAGIAAMSAKQAIETQKAQESLLRAQAARVREQTEKDDIIGDVFQSVKPFTEALGSFTSSAKEGYESLPRLLNAIKDIIKNEYDAFHTDVKRKRNVIKINRANHPDDRTKNWER